VGVVVLGFAMWVAPFTMTQTTCWVAQTGAEGAVVSRQVPETETQTLGPSDLSSGCDGGTVTVQGVALAAVFWIGAVAVAAMASSARHPPAEGTPGS
jgi:hypothetical protein